jgi:CHAD domain-containing protein
MPSSSKLRLVQPELPDAEQGPDNRPHKAGRVVLPHDATTEEAYRATLLNCADHVARNEGAIAEARDSEGVHQARVGLRRVRVAFTSFGESFRGEITEGFSERAKSLFRSLGATREIDVFTDDMLPPIEEAMPRLAGLEVLKLALEDVRAHAWTDTVALVRSTEFTGFVRGLEDYAEARAWRDHAGAERRAGFVEPAVERAADTLDARLERARKDAKHLDDLDEKERHKLRIALKKLRYTAEFYAPLFKVKRVAKFVDRLSDLQDAFGTMNDAATVNVVLDHILKAAPDSVDRAVLRESASFIHGWHRARVGRTWKRARESWREFESATPFWRN